MTRTTTLTLSVELAIEVIDTSSYIQFNAVIKYIRCSKAYILICIYNDSYLFSEITADGRRVTKLDQILLNGNNITMVRK